MKIAIGNDHTAIEMKQEIQKFLEEQGKVFLTYVNVKRIKKYYSHLGGGKNG